MNALPHGQVLEATVNPGGITETICVVFLRSENIPAMFIDTESGSVENIHADKEVKEGTYFTDSAVFEDFAEMIRQKQEEGSQEENVKVYNETVQKAGFS